ncbi:MAG TPA: SDR family oxidoreductase [Geminicoccus sp.]|uniref:SDR family NAD(P)-dependent oxidoreductase n=1 Tax=Geminicoccus sp. TaxID=2024832 RepID=UPI002BEC40CA|nr:SDR family oxidoreductase [Geminicoccus sp.]HWL67337.1 SDR family oxidoreductase [Geminicoccus sp.]
MDLGLKGLKAIVTGGSKGIGRRCADAFAAEGAHVSICARNGQEVDETVAAITAQGVSGFGQALDVADKAALEGWIHASASTLGGIDIVVANVSALAVTDDEASWRKQFEVDMLHSVNTVNAAMPYLEKSKHPSIVLISSVSGREIDFTGPAYGAFKAALIHYAHGLAYKLAPKMIRVNSVSPGNTYFEGGVWHWIENNNPGLFKQALDLNPTGRMATPEEVAKGVVFLASPASSFTTGTNLVIDGALTKGVQY